MEDKAVEVVGQLGQGQFRLGPGDADGADERPEPVLLVGKHMLDPGPDRRLGRIGPCGRDRHRLALGLSPVDAAGQHTIGEPGLVALRAVSAVGPDLAAGVLPVDDLAQHPAIGMGCRSHCRSPDEAITAVNADVAFVAEHRDSDHGQGRVVPAIAHLAADLERPARRCPSVRPWLVHQARSHRSICPP